MPSSGNTNNGNDDSSQKVSIVGTWQQITKYAGEYPITYNLKYVFNQNGTGTFCRTISDETKSIDFRYTFNMVLGELYIQTNYSTQYMSAFIVVDNDKEALHLNAFNTAYTELYDGIFKRIN